MSLKLIFIALCIGAAWVIVLVTLKRSFPEKTKKRSRHSDRSAWAESSISFDTKVLIQPECDSSLIVWIVTSSAEDATGRTALRRAYPGEELKRLSVRRVFLLGVPGKESVRKLLPKESQSFNDVLQGDFLEAYRNLTLKHLMGLRWASRNCVARYLIKTDDDIVLDLWRVLDLFKKEMIEEDAMSGYALRAMLPMRIPANKWFVSKEEFPGNAYPDFLSGWFYATSLRIVERLLARSEVSEFFWIDDVYVTGILRQECGIKIRELNSLYTTDYRYLECCIRGKKKRLRCEFIAGPDGGKRELQMEFKEFAAFCQWNCSERRKEESVGRTCVAAYQETVKTNNSKAQIHSIRS